MFVAQKLKKENIAEYLLYMWQVEDLIRACHLDIDIVRQKYLSRFSDLTEKQQKEQEKWYSELIDMMHSEGVTQKGHLQINNNIINELEELHKHLISSEKFSYYRAAYYNALPAIVDLRKKSGINTKGELETCFNMLYGIMLLRVQGKKIGKDTQDGLNSVSSYISMLGSYYHQNKKEPIDFE